jgi:hypothetical protein
MGRKPSRHVVIVDGSLLISGDAPRPAPRPSAGQVVSVAAHLLFGALLILASPVRLLPIPTVTPIEVEIVTPGELAAAAAPAPAPPEALATPIPAPSVSAPPVAPPTATPKPSVEPGPGGLIIARQFYAADILRQPDMKRIRAILAQVADGDRASQLCIIEGMEQVRLNAPQYDPDVIVPYAMDDARVVGLTIDAPGGAFRSRRQWYGIAFHCTVTAAYDGVTAFSFTLGERIPEDQWEAHNLNASDENEPDDQP